MLEDFGVGELGASGTLAAAALDADAETAPAGAGRVLGLMLPVLEDSILAARTSAGLASVSELLLYSAVCGTGLDTVPLPGKRFSRAARRHRPGRLGDGRRATETR